MTNGVDSVEINPADLGARLLERAELLAARGDYVTSGLLVLARRALALVLEQLNAAKKVAASPPDDFTPPPALPT